MKPTFRLLAMLPLLVGAVGPLAADPPPLPPSVADAPAVRGKVMLVEGDRILEGDIEHVGGRYRIRRSLGETWIPADKAVFLGADLDDVYQFLRRRANLRDADEHLRLARWCLQHGLRERALAEAGEAVALRPRDPDAQKLLGALQPPASGVVQVAAQVPAGDAKPPEPDAAPAAMPEYNHESLGLFVGKVQPILMNACAGCHAAGNGGNFRLQRTAAGSAANARVTQHNLAAALNQVTRDRPAASPLLVKALTPHGGTERWPLKDRRAPAYRLMEEWVTFAVGDPTVARGAGSSAVPANLSATPKAEPLATPAPLPETVTGPMPPSAPAPAPTEQPKPAAPAPDGSDPFDPAVFNRQMHPGRAPASPPPATPDKPK
jgi:hypothetical protein